MKMSGIPIWVRVFTWMILIMNILGHLNFLTGTGPRYRDGSAPISVGLMLLTLTFFAFLTISLKSYQAMIPIAGVLLAQALGNFVYDVYYQSWEWEGTTPASVILIHFIRIGLLIPVFIGWCIAAPLKRRY
jgi:hypothetical protein